MTVIQIPEDYKLLKEWIDDNKQIIFENPQIIKEILIKLNAMLEDAKSSKTLKRDINVMVKTIKTEYDAFFKEISSNLTVDKIIFAVNNNQFDEFFEYCKNNDQGMRFSPMIDLDFQKKEKKKIEKINLKDENYETKQEKPNDCLKREGVQESQYGMNTIVDNIKSNGSTNFYKLILDPNSFSKTVYNVFNLSLAIRKKHLELVSKDDCLLVQLYKGNQNMSKNGEFTITYEKYKDLLKTHNDILN